MAGLLSAWVDESYKIVGKICGSKKKDLATFCVPWGSVDFTLEPAGIIDIVTTQEKK